MCSAILALILALLWPLVDSMAETACNMACFPNSSVMQSEISPELRSTEGDRMIVRLREGEGGAASEPLPKIG